MATTTLRVASMQDGCNGITQGERKDMWNVIVASNHIDGASKYCLVYVIVFYNTSQAGQLINLGSVPGRKFLFSPQYLSQL
jgi:hypothetical protein